jgi:hypothetical protein
MERRSVVVSEPQCLRSLIGDLSALAESYRTQAETPDAPAEALHGSASAMESVIEQLRVRLGLLE